MIVEEMEMVGERSGSFWGNLDPVVVLGLICIIWFLVIADCRSLLIRYSRLIYLKLKNKLCQDL